jgi:pectinesterase
MNRPALPRRRFLLQASSLASLASLSLPGCLARRPADRFDAVVAQGDTVPQGRRYDSLAAAIAAAPPAGTRPFRIAIGVGVWNEKLVVDKPNVHLIGAQRERCRIGSDRAAGHRGDDGDPWGTWGCASVIVRASGFRARSLTFENRFDYRAHLARPVLETVGANGAQAVALMLDAGSDRVVLEDCDIDGHQDTLFAEAGRTWLRRCRVRGSVDFIFGAGECVLDDCEIVSRFRPGKERQGYLTAPSTPATQSVGLLLRRCNLSREAEVPASSVSLGRPWRPTRTFADGRYGDPAVRGSAAFIDCWMDAHIDAHGWDAMNYTARDGGRVAFEPRDARFGEAGSRGPGALRGERRPLLDAPTVQRLRRYQPFR